MQRGYEPPEPSAATEAVIKRTYEGRKLPGRGGVSRLAGGKHSSPLLLLVESGHNKTTPSDAKNG